MLSAVRYYGQSVSDCGNAQRVTGVSAPQHALRNGGEQNLPGASRLRRQTWRRARTEQRSRAQRRTTGTRYTAVSNAIDLGRRARAAVRRKDDSPNRKGDTKVRATIVALHKQNQATSAVNKPAFQVGAKVANTIVRGRHCFRVVNNLLLRVVVIFGRLPWSFLEIFANLTQ